MKNLIILLSESLGAPAGLTYAHTIHTSSSFALNNALFWGYSNLHKGFKCLDISTGRVYISRDVVFDETVFPFAALHPNAGARLRAEILLLSPELLILLIMGAKHMLMITCLIAMLMLLMKTVKNLLF